MKPSSTIRLFLWIIVFSFLVPLLSLQGLGQEAKEQLTLEKAVSLALEGNMLLKAVRADVDVSSARVQQAQSNYWPHLNYDYSISRGNNPVFVFGSKLTQNRFTLEDFSLPRLNNPSPLNNFQNKFSASQVIFDFWRTRRGVALSRIGQQSTQKEVEKTRSDLIFRVIKSYQDALLAQEFVKVAESAVESAEADEQRAANMLQSGLAVESDLLSVKVHKAAQMEELVKARNNLKLAYSALNFEMGLPLEKPFELVKELRQAEPELSSLVEYQTSALQLRPEFQQVELMAKRGFSGSIR